MNYNDEIEKLEKMIEFTRKRIELNEEYGQYSIGGGSIRNFDLSSNVKGYQNLADLLERFASLPDNFLDVPSETIFFYIDYRTEDGIEYRLEICPGFRENILGELYGYVCNSSSEWGSQLTNFVKSSLYNVYEMPSLMIDMSFRSSLEEQGKHFYNRVLDFVHFLNNNVVGKSILKSIDTYYLSLIESVKELQGER